MPVKIGLDAPMTELFMANPDGILVVDRNHCICDANPALARLFELGEQQVTGQNLATLPGEVINHADYDTPLICVTLANNRQRWLQCTLHRVDQIPSTVAELRFYHDITQEVLLRQENMLLDQQVSSAIGNDLLTGLLNPASMIQTLNAEVARSRRYQNPLSIMLIRTHPDSVNDTTMQALAGLLRDQLRWADTVGRSSDTEFTIIFPETHFSAARSLALKIAPLIEKAVHILNQNIEIPRIGIAQWQTGDDSAALIKRATTRLEQQAGFSSTAALG